MYLSDKVIYVERAQKVTAAEEMLLAELSKETFCPGSSFKTIISNDAQHLLLKGARTVMGNCFPPDYHA